MDFLNFAAMEPFMKATPQWWIDERQMQEVFQNIHIITHARRKKRFLPNVGAALFLRRAAMIAARNGAVCDGERRHFARGGPFGTKKAGLSQETGLALTER
ncbi:hypothetical protein [Pyramidobacter sp.]|uniref:hypothetical protein n=1 Tax=Pyramidobacter sp. TaxID=1943581 RepID=UPI0025D94D9F|nr:hypothetical protein [Pyramidobacter sp.]MCI7404182.1 hypothetical protein [Pyramidobacter sp.]MDY3212805.1 hypothetical protein [Pyramidobacter sp.]